MTLKEWMRKSSLTQERLAELVDEECTQALVSKWVRRVVAPSARRVAILLKLSGGLVTKRALVRKVAKKGGA